MSVYFSMLKSRSPISKQFYIDNCKVAKRTIGRIIDAECEVISVDNIKELAEIINGMASNECLLAGLPKLRCNNGKIATGSNLRIKPKSIANIEKGEISRSLDHFTFSNNPGILVIDSDFGRGVPYITPKEFRERLFKLVPVLRDASYVRHYSTSSFIKDVDGSYVNNGLHGYHHYFAVSDASMIPSILESLHARFILNRDCFAYPHIGTRTNQVSIRTYVDTQLKTPVQPIYTQPLICEGVEHDRPLAKYYKGAMEIVSSEAFPKFNARQHMQIRKIRDELKNEIQPQAEKINEDAKEKLIKKFISEGLSKSKAALIAKRKFESGIIRVSDTLYVEVNGKLLKIKAGDIKEGQECLDPLEPEYDGYRIVAKAILGDVDGTMLIHSFAHGDVTYKIVDQRIDLTLDECRKALALRIKAINELDADRNSLRPILFDDHTFLAFYGIEKSNQKEDIDLSYEFRNLLSINRFENPWQKEYVKFVKRREALLQEPKSIYERRKRIMYNRDENDQAFVDRILPQFKDIFISINGMIHEYDSDGVWKQLGSQKAVEAAITETVNYILKNGNKIPTGTMSKIASLIQGSLELNEKTQTRIANDNNYIAFENGVLHIPTRNLLPHKPEHGFTGKLPWTYDKDVKCPHFLKTLIDMCKPNVYNQIQDIKDDFSISEIERKKKIKFLKRNAAKQKRERFKTLHLAVAKLVQGSNTKMFLEMYGPSNTGKTMLIEVMSMLVGRENVYGTRIERLNDRFESGSMNGKRLIAIAEAKEFAGKVAGFIKAATGDDDIPIEIKGKQQFSAKLSRSLFVIASNNKVKITDADPALRNRRMVVKLENVVTRKIQNFNETFIDEIPGIINWALQLDEKTQQKYLEELRRSQDNMVHMVETEKLHKFINDCLEINENLATGIGSLIGKGRNPLYPDSLMTVDQNNCKICEKRLKFTTGKETKVKVGSDVRAKDVFIYHRLKNYFEENSWELYIKNADCAEKIVTILNEDYGFKFVRKSHTEIGSAIKGVGLKQREKESYNVVESNQEEISEYDIELMFAPFVDPDLKYAEKEFSPC